MLLNWDNENAKNGGIEKSTQEVDAAIGEGYF